MPTAHGRRGRLDGRSFTFHLAGDEDTLLLIFSAIDLESGIRRGGNATVTVSFDCVNQNNNVTQVRRRDLTEVFPDSALLDGRRLNSSAAAVPISGELLWERFCMGAAGTIGGFTAEYRADAMNRAGTPGVLAPAPVFFSLDQNLPVIVEPPTR